MDENKLFSTRIKELRESLGLSQAEFAKSVGTTQTTLSSYENIDKTPSLDILKEIASKYNISLDWLCGLSDKKTLSGQIGTYTDLINIIINLKDASNISAEFSLKKNTPVYNLFDEPYHTLLYEINDKHIVDFFEEWQDILSVCKKSPSGDKLYQIWLKDVLERYNFPLEDAHQEFSINEELPFN